MVTFSRLVAEMRAGIEDRLKGEDPMIARLAMGEASAAQIANAFFAICKREADLDEEEEAVATRLASKVHDAFKERNNIAHGDWSLDWGDVSAARLIRTKPNRREGDWVERVRPADELEAVSDELEILTGQVMEFGWLCFGHHPLTRHKGMDVRIRDIFRFQKRKGVLRTGRYANTLPWEDEEEAP
jgi:hypothetical protein